MKSTQTTSNATSVSSSIPIDADTDIELVRETLGRQGAKTVMHIRHADGRLAVKKKYPPEAGARFQRELTALRDLMDRHDVIPTYLNPIDGIWGRAKYVDLANFVPDAPDHFLTELAWLLRDQRLTPSLLRSLFAHAGLAL